MNRRGFFGRLAGAASAPIAAVLSPATPLPDGLEVVSHADAQRVAVSLDTRKVLEHYGIPQSGIVDLSIGQGSTIGTLSAGACNAEIKFPTCKTELGYPLD